MPFIKDALYSYMAIPEYMEPLMDSMPVQRLRRIRQLAGTEYVYPGATHTRFEHSIGVMYLAGRLCDLLNQNADYERKRTVVSPEEKKVVMASALVHDIGHGPFSHVFEKLYEDDKKNHEDFTRWLVKGELAGILESMGLDPDVIAKVSTGGKLNQEKVFMSQIVAGTIDCDSLDYLVRDSYYTGALVGNLDVSRILLMTRVMDGNIVFDLKAGIPILESYFMLRLNSFKQIYYHKTSRAAQIMILKALEHCKEEFCLGQFTEPADFLKWDDYTIWTTIQHDSYIKKLKQRDMIKMVYESGAMSPFDDKGALLSAEEISLLEEEIAAKAGVDASDVFIDVPYLPTVPYAHATAFDPEDIPIYIPRDNRITTLSELSTLFSILKGYYNLMRVYTWEPYRKAVSRASRELLLTAGM